MKSQNNLNNVDIYKIQEKIVLSLKESDFISGFNEFSIPAALYFKPLRQILYDGGWNKKINHYINVFQQDFFFSRCKFFTYIQEDDKFRIRIIDFSHYFQIVIIHMLISHMNMIDLITSPIKLTKNHSLTNTISQSIYINSRRLNLWKNDIIPYEPQNFFEDLNKLAKGLTCQIESQLHKEVDQKISPAHSKIAFKTNHPAILVIDINKHYKIIHANEEAENYYEISREQLKTMNIFDLASKSKYLPQQNIDKNSPVKWDCYYEKVKIDEVTNQTLQIYHNPIQGIDGQYLMVSFLPIHNLKKKSFEMDLPYIYKLAFEQCQNANLLYSEKSGIIRANPRFFELFHVSKKDDISKFDVDEVFSNCKDIISFMDIKISHLLKIVHKKNYLNSHYLVTRYDKTQFYAEITISKLELNYQSIYHINISDKSMDYLIRKQNQFKNRYNLLINNISSKFDQNHNLEEIIDYFCRHFEDLFDSKAVFLLLRDLESKQFVNLKYSSILDSSEEERKIILKPVQHIPIVENTPLYEVYEQQQNLELFSKQQIKDFLSSIIPPENCEENEIIHNIEKYEINFCYDFPLIAQGFVIGNFSMVYSHPMEAWKQETVPLILKRVAEIINHKQIELQLRKTSQQLQKNNEELRNFAYIISHDLKEPLHTISAYTALISKRFKDKLDGDALDFMNFIIDGTERMNSMISGLLSLTRVNTQGNNFGWVELEKVIQAVRLNLHNQILRYQAEIIIPKNIPAIYGDFNQIVQLIQNIISNGIKFHKTNIQPVIEISSQEDNQFIMVSIKDNGIGIPQKFISEIFKIFRRLNPRSKFDGTGIGLSICERIMERHKGCIAVNSIEGEGTIFYLNFPKNMRNFPIDSEQNNPD